MTESAVLTEAIILAKAGKKKPEDITKLNAFAMGVERIITLKPFVNLEIVSLSLNKMTSLEVFADCLSIKEIHLRKNNVSSINELEHLANLPGLHTLLLSDNPCTKLDGYRSTAIRLLKYLRKLDSLQVTEEEKLVRVENSSDDMQLVAEDMEIQIKNDDNSRQNFVRVASDDKYETCTANSSLINSSTNVATDTLATSGDDLFNSKNNSNTLLAVKLLLAEMNMMEVEQVRRWCDEKLSNRKE